MGNLSEVTSNEANEMKLEKKFRVQLDFDQKDMQTINNLVEELDLGTRAELFRSSLRVLRWMAQKKSNGCAVVAITPEQRYIEPDFEFLDRIIVHGRDAEGQKGPGDQEPSSNAPLAVNPHG